MRNRVLLCVMALALAARAGLPERSPSVASAERGRSGGSPAARAGGPPSATAVGAAQGRGR